MKKVLLFGNKTAQYHPVSNIENCMRELIAEGQLETTDNPMSLRLANLNQYDFCIFYPEFGMPELTDEQTGALLTFVSSGGNLLVIHNGISLQSRSEICQMIGAAFTGHPPYDTLPQIDYHVEAPGHPLMNGIRDFVMGDEPYQFIMDPFAACQLLMSCDFEGKRLPAAWIRRFGRGTVVYYACGHNREAFKNPNFVRILKNTVAYFLK